jgi:hypothetical protein
MTTLTLQSLAGGEVEPPAFVDEASLPAAGKQQILADWQRFISGGFKKLLFSRDLYRFLHHNCDFIAHTNQEIFWAYYFNAEVNRLRLFLNQFGGSGQSAESGARTWLRGPAADLKGAMCQAMVRLYLPLLQLLEALELKHAELGRVWREFTLRQTPPPGPPSTGLLRQAQDVAQDAALHSRVPEPGYPPHYRVGENARNLLAYAAATTLHQPQPLQGLQRQFPPFSSPAEAGLYTARAA